MARTETLVTTRALPREDWSAYFRAHARELAQGHSDDAILRTEPALDEGPLEIRRLQLQELTYEPADELFEVVAAGLRHFVLHPATVHVDEEMGQLLRLEFTFHNGATESLELA